MKQNQTGRCRAMTAANHVTAIAVFSEKNPQRKVVKFSLGLCCGKESVSTRIRLATTQKLVAVAQINGELVFGAEMFSAISANPYLAFHSAATGRGTLSLTWEGDNGFSQAQTVTFTVA